MQTLLAFGLGNGDEILVPSFSFISTANAVLFVNATPSFVDIEEETLGLNPNLITEKNISQYESSDPNGLWWYVM